MPLPPTYVIYFDENEKKPTIWCAICDSVTSLLGDVENKYCGRCHRFHEDQQHVQEQSLNTATPKTIAPTC